MDVSVRGDSPGFMFAKEKVAKASIETGTVREGENFESHTKGVRESHGRGYFSLLKD
jgi:hypothetical protein